MILLAEARRMSYAISIRECVGTHFVAYNIADCNDAHRMGFHEFSLLCHAFLFQKLEISHYHETSSLVFLKFSCCPNMSIIVSDSILMRSNNVNLIILFMIRLQKYVISQ